MKFNKIKKFCHENLSIEMVFWLMVPIVCIFFAYNIIKSSNLESYKESVISQYEKFKNEDDHGKKIRELKDLLYLDLDLGKDSLNSYKTLKYISDNEEIFMVN